ncbi:MAG: Fur family transcriptional regulator [Candidatus Peribacteraceae bacterium]
MDFPSLLARANLSNTVQRRAILSLLSSSTTPLSHADMALALRKKKVSIDTATIYRIFKQFLEKGIVHRHPSTGAYVLCALPSCTGHHGFLTCSECHSVTEFADTALCQAEHAVARSFKFKPQKHVTDVVGLCASCQ